MPAPPPDHVCSSPRELPAQGRSLNLCGPGQPHLPRWSRRNWSLRDPRNGLISSLGQSLGPNLEVLRTPCLRCEERGPGLCGRRSWDPQGRGLDCELCYVLGPEGEVPPWGPGCPWTEGPRA